MRIGCISSILNLLQVRDGRSELRCDSSGADVTSWGDEDALAESIIELLCVEFA